MDHLWRPVKGRIAANRQYKAVDQEAEIVEQYIHQLSPMKTLGLAGILAEDFWLPTNGSAHVSSASRNGGGGWKFP